MSDLEKLWRKNEDLKRGDAPTSAEKIFMSDEYGCNKCFDRGYYISKGKAYTCEECDGIPGAKKRVKPDEVKLEVILDALGIPVFNRGREFNPDILKTDKSLSVEARNSPLLDFYIHNLKLIHDYFVLGKKLDNSYLIMAPQGFSKSHLVFSAMELAARAGMSVVPYYSSEDIYRMHYEKEYDKLDWISGSDVCFIRLSPAFVSKRDTQAVKYILDRRSRNDLPTVVTSRFNMEYLKQIEPHLENNFGVRDVEKGDYSKLKAVLGVYPRDYSLK